VPRPKSNRNNPRRGRRFEELAQACLTCYFQTNLDRKQPIEIGRPPKSHCFDLASADRRIVGECKNYSWTASGNVPSAKLGFLNEAAFYLSFLPQSTIRFIVLRRQMKPRSTRTSARGEPLADYYHRTHRHLLNGTIVLEIDSRTKTVRSVGRASA
jgi:hypothetical protein